MLVMRLGIASVAVLAAALASSCQSERHVTQPPRALRCIVTGEPAHPDGPRANYRGHEVFFCCEQCARRWRAWTDEAKQTAFDRRP